MSPGKFMQFEQTEAGVSGILKCRLVAVEKGGGVSGEGKWVGLGGASGPPWA